MGKRFRKIPEFKWQLRYSNLSQSNPLFNPCLSHLASLYLKNLKKETHPLNLFLTKWDYCLPVYFGVYVKSNENGELRCSVT